MSRWDVIMLGLEEYGMANVVVVLDDEVDAPRRPTTPAPYRRFEEGGAWSFPPRAWIHNNINSTADIVVSMKQLGEEGGGGGERGGDVDVPT
jgi:hypothetical protein